MNRALLIAVIVLSAVALLHGAGAAVTESSCNDNADNDADGLKDCADPDCVSLNPLLDAGHDLFGIGYGWIGWLTLPVF